MTVSTRGRYALRVMVELAEHGNEFIPLKAVAERQNISQKYLESIMTGLSKAGLVEGAHGKGGGYRLCRAPEDYTVREILKITEGELAPVACLKKDSPACDMAERCRTLPMWRELYKTLNSFFDSYTVADLAAIGSEDRGSWII